MKMVNTAKNITREEAEQSIANILQWLGEDINRDGLKETPKRVIKAFDEFFAGYKESPEQHLQKTFKEVEGYRDMVMLRGIPFVSHCEHHMLPIIGHAFVVYS